MLHTLELASPCVSGVTPAAKRAYLLVNFLGTRGRVPEKVPCEVTRSYRIYHKCWGNPLAQRIESSYSYKSALPYLDRLDVDVITFETADNNGAEIAEIAAALSKDKKICIGVVSHRTLQVEMPQDVAGLIRKALKHIPPERLILSSDCGFGRQGMSRMHALYKMIAIVRGTNIIRHELGLPQAEIPAADPRFAWI